MKRPLIPVALVYVAGLLLASCCQLPLIALFGLALVLLLPAVIFSKARRFLLWPLLVLAGWINLTQ